MKGEPKFILIDDNFINGFIAKKILEGMGLNNAIRSFLDAGEALEFIQTQKEGSAAKTILLVDLQMPQMNGFSFLRFFEQLPEHIRSRYVVYIVTSSINQADKTMADNFPSVRKFVSKPLTTAVVSNILEENYN